MQCPVCGHDNLEGLDNCENCNSDLRTSDIPAAQRKGVVENELITGHLSELKPRTPVTVPSSDSAEKAVQTMQAEQIGCVLVTEGDGLVGIFTERDALLKLAGKPLAGISITDVMTPDPVVLREDDTLAVALHKMAIGQFRHMPLVENGKPTGIISARDLFNHIIRYLN